MWSIKPVIFNVRFNFDSVTKARSLIIIKLERMTIIDNVEYKIKGFSKSMDLTSVYT